MIARRDFIATVYSRSFILFLLVPLVIFGVSILAGRGRTRPTVNSQPVVALADSATVQPLTEARPPRRGTASAPSDPAPFSPPRM